MSIGKHSRLCKVCHFGKIGHGGDFCEACRSFYIRHQRRGELPCKNNDGNFKCLSIEGNESIDDFCISYKNGVNRRLLCPGCRLAKCKRIKMKIPLQNQLVPYSPPSNEPIEGEFVLNMVVEASRNFSQNLDQLPFRSAKLQCSSSMEAWNLYVTTMEQQVVSMKRFASQFPFYRKLSMQDRINHMLTVKQRLVVGENLINPNGLFIACLSNESQETMCQYLPQFDTMKQQAIITRQRIKSLNWNEADFALLLAFLCFDGKFISTVLHCYHHFNFNFTVTDQSLSSEGARLFQDGISQLEIAYLNLLRNHCQSEENASMKMNLIKKVAIGIGEEASWRRLISRNNYMVALHDESNPHNTLITTIMDGKPKQL